MSGRKTLFKNHMMKEGYLLARHGLIIEEIADFWGVHRATLHRWLNKYPEFCDTLKKAKDEADRNVENKLYKRAIGYQYDEKHYELRGGEVKLTKRITKEVQPDTTAQIFWLKNRQPNKWRDKQEIDAGENLKAIIERIITREKPPE